MHLQELVQELVQHPGLQAGDYEDNEGKRRCQASVAQRKYPDEHMFLNVFLLHKYYQFNGKRNKPDFKYFTVECGGADKATDSSVFS